MDTIINDPTTHTISGCFIQCNDTNSPPKSYRIISNSVLDVNSKPPEENSLYKYKSYKSLPENKRRQKEKQIERRRRNKKNH